MVCVELHVSGKNMIYIIEVSMLYIIRVASEYQNMVCGILQGPILFLLYVNDLANMSKNKNVYSLQTILMYFLQVQILNMS